MRNNQIDWKENFFTIDDFIGLLSSLGGDILSAAAAADGISFDDWADRISP